MADQTDDQAQRVLQAQKTVRSAVPGLPSTPIEPMSRFDQLIAKLKEQMTGGQVQALQHPGRISYRPSLVGSMSQQQLEDLIAHELTHVQKGPDEDVAYQGEKDYALASHRSMPGDVKLPPSKKIEQTLLMRELRK